MPDSIFVEGGVIVPSDALEMHAVRSSGPGGQNVNKVASKIELRVELDRIQGITPAGLKRLRHLVAKRLDGTGRLLVTSQRTRDQYRNLEDARRKVHDWIAKALRPPKSRVASAPTASAKERRLRQKHLRALRKQSRQHESFMEEE
jgi:ribosome-associated protein